MKVKYILDPGAYAPEKAHYDDAGFDIRTPVALTVDGFDQAVVDTGVHVQIPHGYVGMLKSKSGLNVKHSLRGEGVIDAGYTGSIVVKLYSDGPMDYHFERGDKIIQLVILPVPDVEMEPAKALDKSERMSSGFGSSGR